MIFVGVRVAAPPLVVEEDEGVTVLFTGFDTGVTVAFTGASTGVLVALTGVSAGVLVAFTLASTGVLAGLSLALAVELVLLLLLRGAVALLDCCVSGAGIDKALLRMALVCRCKLGCCECQLRLES